MMVRTALILLGLACPTLSAEYPVKVVAITDGDTIGVIDAEKRYFKVRLAGIDAPERKQAFSEKNKEALAAKIFEKVVILDDRGKDRYCRTLGVIKLDRRNINGEMVAECWAWQFVRYDKSAELRTAGSYARRNRLGLWNDKAPIAPCDYRKSAR